MDTSVQRLLSDRVYDKRKAGALELEALIRNALADGNHDRIARIVHQLCHDYAYAVHTPHARNGGLIGLAAAAIALGSEVARYLKEIVPPVLACFSDHDARVRYYACESMYNISKVAKGEILVYFNDVFDALCKLAADSELSVKNGAELLDRLVKDIISESAATYASVLAPESDNAEKGRTSGARQGAEVSMAFSLPRFIPLLQERVNALDPFTRTFLVSWITLLDSIPDLELVAYLPSFLGGLLRFLSDQNQDVHTTTKVALDRFLAEIQKISAIQKGILYSKKSREELVRRTSGSQNGIADENSAPARTENETQDQQPRTPTESSDAERDWEGGIAEATSSMVLAGDDEKDDAGFEDEWIPGQDVHIDYPKILDILVTFLLESSEQEIQLTTLKWIESFLDICPEDILSFTPRLLAQVLPALSHDVDHVKQAANRVNQSLMAYIISLPEESTKSNEREASVPQQTSGSGSAPSIAGPKTLKDLSGDHKPSALSLPSKGGRKSAMSPEPAESAAKTPDTSAAPEPAEEEQDHTSLPTTDLDYEGAVNALTLQFLHEHEATRVAALAWLIMLHRKSPRKILAIQDATFPALLKTLSDPAEAVVTRDLLLLSQISKSSNDSYFTSFMVNLLKLFCTDRRLLEVRGNLIIRQLSLSLSAEKIYRTMADCLERDEDDIDFASIMVQNLNNNLITAPELQDLRKRLRNLDTRDGQTFFTVLFRAWCVNAVATFSLCLLAQAYEQAYNLLQIIAELEMTVNMLIQIDKLVQLLESPVFTYLRMQLLEPERHPHLYKCLYGLLMLLPQSSAFAALKNRLNSVSAIGYLHMPRPGGGPGGSTTASGVSSFEGRNRLKSRDEGGIRWAELLEKFRATQERVRRSQQRALANEEGGLPQGGMDGSTGPARSSGTPVYDLGKEFERSMLPGRMGPSPPPVAGQGSAAQEARKRGLSHLGRFAGGVGKGKNKK